MQPAMIAADHKPSRALALDMNGERTTRRERDDLGGHGPYPAKVFASVIASARCCEVIFGSQCSQANLNSESAFADASDLFDAIGADDFAPTFGVGWEPFNEPATFAEACFFLAVRDLPSLPLVFFNCGISAVDSSSVRIMATVLSSTFATDAICRLLFSGYNLE